MLKFDRKIPLKWVGFARKVCELSVTLAIGDSNPLVLSSLSEVFERDSRFSLVSTASTAEAFIGSVIRVPVDIGVIDWDLPVMGGKRLTETLRDQPQPPRVVVYGARTEIAVQQAMQSGVAGFCARDSSATELTDVCAAVSQGKMIFPFMDIRAIKQNPLTTLTRREYALLEALSTGKTNRELAKTLEISENTVKFHLSNVYDKIGANNRAKAVALFMTLREEF